MSFIIYGYTAFQILVAILFIQNEIYKNYKYVSFITKSNNSNIKWQIKKLTSTNIPIISEHCLLA